MVDHLYRVSAYGGGIWAAGQSNVCMRACPAMEVTYSTWRARDGGEWNPRSGLVSNFLVIGNIFLAGLFADSYIGSVGLPQLTRCLWHSL